MNLLTHCLIHGKIKLSSLTEEIIAIIFFLLVMMLVLLGILFLPLDLLSVIIATIQLVFDVNKEDKFMTGFNIRVVKGGDGVSSINTGNCTYRTTSHWVFRQTGSNPAHSHI